jgi:predicted secreted hydrolase
MLSRADGASRPLAPQDVDILAWDTWESPDGGRYPARWKLRAGPLGRELEIRPALADQEFRLDARYWEGAVDVLDAATGRPAGRGYVELTGYAPGKIEKSGD